MFGMKMLAVITVSMIVGAFAGIAVMLSAFTAFVITFVVAAPIVNNNYRGPACGERPTMRDGVRFTPRITACEECGAVLK